MAIKPLADRIVLETVEAEEKTAGGIFIPDNAKEKPQKAVVVAVGPGKKGDNGDLIAMEVQVGQTVLYSKFSGTEVNEGGKDLLVVRESDIIAIVD